MRQLAVCDGRIKALQMLAHALDEEGMGAAREASAHRAAHLKKHDGELAAMVSRFSREEQARPE